MNRPMTDKTALVGFGMPIFNLETYLKKTIRCFGFLVIPRF